MLLLFGTQESALEQFKIIHSNMTEAKSSQMFVMLQLFIIILISIFWTIERSFLEYLTKE